MNAKIIRWISPFSILSHKEQRQVNHCHAENGVVKGVVNVFSTSFSPLLQFYDGTTGYHPFSTISNETAANTRCFHSASKCSCYVSLYISTFFQLVVFFIFPDFVEYKNIFAIISTICFKSSTIAGFFIDTMINLEKYLSCYKENHLNEDKYSCSKVFCNLTSILN